MVQFDVDRNNLQKTVSDLEKKLKDSQDKEAKPTVELDNGQRALWPRIHWFQEVGYCSSCVVKASTSDMKNDEDMKLKAPTMTPTRTFDRPPARKPTEAQGRIR